MLSGIAAVRLCTRNRATILVGASIAIAICAGGAALVPHLGLGGWLTVAGVLHDPDVPERFLRLLSSSLWAESPLLATVGALALARSVRPSLRGARLLAATTCGVAVLPCCCA